MENNLISFGDFFGSIETIEVDLTLSEADLQSTFEVFAKEIVVEPTT